MPDLDLIAVLVAAAAALVAGGAYYAVLGNQLAEAGATVTGDRMPSWVVAVEALRCLVLATVVAGLAARGDIAGWNGGLVLGAVLWIGFPLVLWAGAVVHEKTPLRLAAIHAGDWLVKLLLVAVIVTTLP